MHDEKFCVRRVAKPFSDSFGLCLGSRRDEKKESDYGQGLSLVVEPLVFFLCVTSASSASLR